MTRRIAALLVLIGTTGIPGALCAQEREVIERVVAVVNDEPIFLSDLRRRALPFLEQAMEAPSETQRLALLERAYGEILGNLIDEELVLQTARDMQLRVSTEDVDRAIDNTRQGIGLEEDRFWEEVRTQGFTESQYRSQVRRQLLRFKVLNVRARSRINIAEDEVRARYDQMVRESNQDTCFEVSMIVLRVEDGAGATAVAQVREQAEELHSGLTRDNFTDHGAVDLGSICRGELNPALDAAMAAMRAGEISEPIRGPAGYYIVRLGDQVVRGGEIPPFDQIRDQLFRSMFEQAMARQEQILMQELRREAVVDRRL